MPTVHSWGFTTEEYIESLTYQRNRLLERVAALDEEIVELRKLEAIQDLEAISGPSE